MGRRILDTPTILLINIRFKHINDRRHLASAPVTVGHILNINGWWPFLSAITVYQLDVYDKESDLGIISTDMQLYTYLLGGYWLMVYPPKHAE